MITADKIFKGTTQVSKIYQGQNLVWQQPITKYIKWQPTTYISASGNYSKSLSGKESDSVKLLIKGYTSIDITISYSGSRYQEDHYIKAYDLDSTSYVKGEINMKTSSSKTITYTIPDDGAEHSIYFSCYGGFYWDYKGTFNVSYSNASNASIKWDVPDRFNGNVYTWRIPNVEVGTEKGFFTLKGTKKVNITAYIITSLDEDRDHPNLTFTCFKPNSTEILKTLEITTSIDNPTANSNTATFDILGEGVVNFEVKHNNWEVTNILQLTVNSIE